MYGNIFRVLSFEKKNQRKKKKRNQKKRSKICKMTLYEIRFIAEYKFSAEQLLSSGNSSAVATLFIEKLSASCCCSNTVLMNEIHQATKRSNIVVKHSLGQVFYC